MPRTVEEALQALARLTNYERTRPDGPRPFDLRRPARLLERLGAPHRRLGARVVQVAGTKGKGSVSRYLDAVFRAAGLRTGLFTSPHLEDVRERIAVDGEPIPPAAFAACVGQVLEAVDDETTFFEATVAVACLHFAARGTQAVVLEVGLGGRLDATTVVPATHTVITGIGFDHTELLGDTLAQIAAEKAATIRMGTPVYSGVARDSEAGAVIAATALAREAPVHWVGPPADVTIGPDGVRWGGIRLRALGRHQAHNAALAATAAGDLPRDAIARGLAAATQPACCEVRGTRPRVVVDGAHNVPSIETTVRALGDHFPGARPAVVFALAQDKDLDGIATRLAPAAGAVFCTRADSQRGRAPDALAAHPAWQGRARAIPAPLDALLAARDAAGPGGLVLVTGSLYLAGALRRHT